MTKDRIYLDWNATAPLHPAARAAMVAAFDLEGNASSVHADGRRARAVVEYAREAVAALAGAAPADVVFTSGATEANVTVLAAGWDQIILAGVEHESVLTPARSAGARLTWVPVDRVGLADVGAIATAILASPLSQRTLVCLQAANNETGVVQSIGEVAAFCRAHGVPMLVDAVQVAGRLDVAAITADATFVTLSAHKLGGPKGVGALVRRGAASLPALISGGGQERRRRAGTENVAGIAGFGAAAQVAHTLDWAGLATRHRAFEHRLLAAMPGAVILGMSAERLPNTTCLAYPGQAAETLLIKLDLAGCSVSSGAACSSGKVGSSHVLAAMGVSADLARSAIRISIGPTTSDTDLTAFLDIWTRTVRPAATSIAA